MNLNRNKISIRNVKIIIAFIAMVGIAMFSACSKQDGYLLAATKVTSVIQINANTAAYSITSAPDVISFTTGAIDASTPALREYLLSGISANGITNFTLAFHTNTVGSGKYVMEGSQLTIGAKTYLCLAEKSTDNVTVTTLDDTHKTYSGTFSFYSFNQASATDSVLVTGTYSIQ